MNARAYVERSVADRAPSSMMARHVLHLPIPRVTRKSVHCGDLQ